MASTKLWEKVFRLCERRGFVLKHGSEVSFGPLGVEMKRNLLNEWWMNVVTSSGNMYPVCSPMHNFSSEMMSSSSDSSDSAGLSGHLLSSDACNAVVNQMEPALPYGLAEVGKDGDENCAGPEISDSDICGKVLGKKSTADSVTESEVGAMKFICSKEKLKHFYNSWCRRRLLWWEKLSNNSSNFEKKKKSEHCQVIQFTSPDGSDRVLEEWLWSDRDSLFTQHSSVSISTLIDEAALAFLCDSYREDVDPQEDSYKMLQLHFSLAPYKVVVLSEETCNDDNHRIDMYAKKLAEELRLAGYSTAQSLSTFSVDEELLVHDELGTVCRVLVNSHSLQDGLIQVVERDTSIRESLKETELLDYLLFRHKWTGS